MKNGEKLDIGSKLKNLRLANNLTQEELAARCDLSKGFISLVERNLTSPSIQTLADILDSLGSELGVFFAEEHNDKIVFSPEDIFETIDDDLGHKIEWLVSNAQKNHMEPIMATLEPNGVLFEEDAHDGEEFGFILAGCLTLKIGTNTYTVKKGESFYYQSNRAHKLYNIGKRSVKLIMVSSPPNF